MSKPQLTNEPWDAHLIRYGMPFAKRLIEKARGTLIWDSEGREILDFTSGQMCATLGHNHPRIVAAIEQACEGALWSRKPLTIRKSQGGLETIRPPGKLA